MGLWRISKLYTILLYINIIKLKGEYEVSDVVDNIGFERGTKIILKLKVKYLYMFSNLTNI